MSYCDWCHRQESEYVLIHQVFTFGKDNVTYLFCDARCADMFAKRYILPDFSKSMTIDDWVERNRTK